MIDPLKALELDISYGFGDAIPVVKESPDGEYVLYSAALARENALLEALDEAETALVNCVPITPYKGDGPLVSIRKTIAEIRATQGGPQ